MNRSPVFIGLFYTAYPLQGTGKPRRISGFCQQGRRHVTYDPRSFCGPSTLRPLLSTSEKLEQSMEMKREESKTWKQQGTTSKERQAEKRLQLLATVARRKDVVEGRREEREVLPLRAREIWDSMGIIPWFTLFLFATLAIKLVREAFGLKEKEEKKGPKASVAASTTEEQQQELHVFKCGGCGYVMYPARGREFKFFPESFKCPLCQAPKSEFWDLNDLKDPRNWQEDDAEEEEMVRPIDEGNSDTQDAEIESPVRAIAARNERGILEDDQPSDILHTDEDGATDISRPTEEVKKEVNDVESETST